MRERTPLSRFFFMRLGFFGGTFNPVHLGHLALAETAIKLLQLDHLWWLPANPWQKNAADLMPKEKRLALLRLAIADRQSMSIDTRELDRKTVSYSIDTVRELAALYPKDQRFYLIGSDQWKNFHTWKHWKELFNYVTFVIVVRNGIWEDPDQEVTDFLQSNHIEILKMPMPAIDMDSSRIRTLLTEFNTNRDQLRAALPAAVFDYLKSKTASKAC